MPELRERVRNALVTNIALQGKRQNILLQIESDTGLFDVQQMLDARELADAAIAAVLQDLEAPSDALLRKVFFTGHSEGWSGNQTRRDVQHIDAEKGWSRYVSNGALKKAKERT